MDKHIAKNFRSVMESVFTFTLFLVLMSGCSAHKHVANSVDTVVYSNDSVTTKAEFPGGQGEYYRYMNNNYESPSHIWILGGEAVYSFVVNKEGSVQDIKVIQSGIYAVDKQITRIIKKMPKWKPATLNGEPVCVEIIYKKNFGPFKRRTSAQNNGRPSMARLSGGYLGLDNYLDEYKDIRVTKGMGGSVKVEFIVDESGNAIKPRIVQGLNPRANSIALRIVRNMPRWIPAQKNGKPVQSTETISIYFRGVKDDFGEMKSYK